MELPKHVEVPKNKRYAKQYIWIRIKRFLALNIMAFSFQYLCIYHLKTVYPLYPVYPAIGIAFSVIMILGANAVTGLLLGEVVAYYLKGFSATSLLLYSSADLLPVFLGAYLCRDIFKSDIPKLATLKVWSRFFATILFITTLSAFMRITAIIIKEAPIQSWKNIIFAYLDVWLADFNAIVLFYAFLMTWLSIYMSREKISSKKMTVFHGISFCVFMVLTIVFMKKISLIYFLLCSMALSYYFAYCYGMVVTTLLMYAISMFYLAYFMTHQVVFLNYLGVAGYLFIPIILCCYILSCVMMAKMSAP